MIDSSTSKLLAGLTPTQKEALQNVKATGTDEQKRAAVQALMKVRDQNLMMQKSKGVGSVLDEMPIRPVHNDVVSTAVTANIKPQVPQVPKMKLETKPQQIKLTNLFKGILAKAPAPATIGAPTGSKSLVNKGAVANIPSDNSIPGIMGPGAQNKKLASNDFSRLY